jgi:AraC-like DNA-binding protein
MPMPVLQYGGLGVHVESEDSSLGRWLVARWSPPGESPLSAAVERIWYFEGTMSYARERVFPDGRAELIVMLDEPHRDGDTEMLSPFPTVCINGLRTRPSVVVAPAGRCRVLGIRLEPLGASLLLRSSMRELVDVTIDLQDAMGRSAARLGERCANAAERPAGNGARNAVAVVTTAAEWMMEQMRGEAAGDAAVRWACRVIGAARGAVSVDEIGSELALPRSRLARRFGEHVGVTPKRFARIVRFHHALSLMGRAGSIAEVASDLAYYDQAHLSRDFAEFAGMTPGAFIAANRYPNSASLAEV